MKRIILISSLAVASLATMAQTTVEGSKFSDNWSIGINGGLVTPLKNYKFIDNSRGVVGLNLQKQIIPAFGLGVEAAWSVNTDSWYNGVKSKTMFDHSYVGAYGALNLMNAFGGYKGTPRLFELELTAGAGWIHAYNTGLAGDDGNSWGTKVGLNFNFNLGEKKIWTLSLKPAILWNMGANDVYYTNNLYSWSSRYNANCAAFELTAGLTYHFKNSNGTHNFVIARLYDQNEIDGLNSQINGLRNDLENCNSTNAALQQKINQLQAELDACLARAPQVKEVVKNLNNVRYVFFRLGSSYIQANQKPAIEMTAQALKENSDMKVAIDGYASPEGSKAINERLSQRRADAVKNALVKNYGISDSQISRCEGKGVGDIFSVPSWNRTVVTTVE